MVDNGLLIHLHRPAKITTRIAKSRSYVYSEFLPLLFLPLLIPETNLYNVNVSIDSPIWTSLRYISSCKGNANLNNQWNFVASRVLSGSVCSVKLDLISVSQLDTSILIGVVSSNPRMTSVGFDYRCLSNFRLLWTEKCPFVILTATKLIPNLNGEEPSSLFTLTTLTTLSHDRIQNWAHFTWIKITNNR